MGKAPPPCCIAAEQNQAETDRIDVSAIERMKREHGQVIQCFRICVRFKELYAIVKPSWSGGMPSPHRGAPTKQKMRKKTYGNTRTNTTRLWSQPQGRLIALVVNTHDHNAREHKQRRHQHHKRKYLLIATESQVTLLQQRHHVHEEQRKGRIITRESALGSGIRRHGTGGCGGGNIDRVFPVSVSLVAAYRRLIMSRYAQSAEKYWDLVGCEIKICRRKSGGWQQHKREALVRLGAKQSSKTTHTTNRYNHPCNLCKKRVRVLFAKRHNFQKEKTQHGTVDSEHKRTRLMLQKVEYEYQTPNASVVESPTRRTNFMGTNCAPL